ncbi:voltage-dependent L-type calcium channel subunit [Parasponia andersonii]|uniref:Voltage-dependent L-type calcium channel subunit n=1 Tax=Parasponia andersonii TaxID=3476 RepID=A0A2P5DNY4_PARAD|nr:voltage-dependent L-type calcium channel subunit [Parasponia andersonii]
MAENSNGGLYVANEADTKGAHRDENTLYGVLRRLISSIFFPDSTTAAATPLLHRIKSAIAENAPLLPEASKNTARNVLLWTKRGSPLRALLVISVGTITLVAMTGLLVFTLFFLVATFNAIVISLLISLAAAGGFLALFFAGVTAVYIGALSIAAFVISATAISTIVAILIATGWIGFFCTLWLATKKSVGLAKHSLSVTGSALSAYSTARHARHHPVVDKDSD